MNLHVPQTEEARAEASILCSVQENILSPRFGGPIIGGIHDHISGIFMLTHDMRWFTKEEALYLLRSSPASRGCLRPARWRTAWSMEQQAGLLADPPEQRSTWSSRPAACQNCDICKKEVCERTLTSASSTASSKSGTIDKKAIGAFDGQIVNRIIRQYGMKRATEFIDQVNQTLDPRDHDRRFLVRYR